jgi:hypothetical protein
MIQANASQQLCINARKQYVNEIKCNYTMMNTHKKCRKKMTYLLTWGPRPMEIKS